jgi:transcription elongation factor GreA-like protein
MQLKTIDKNDYLYNRLDVNFYNEMVNSYNKETDFCKRLDIHNHFKNFVTESLTKRLNQIEDQLKCKKL